MLYIYIFIDMLYTVICLWLAKKASTVNFGDEPHGAVSVKPQGQPRKARQSMVKNDGCSPSK